MSICVRVVEARVGDNEFCLEVKEVWSVCEESALDEETSGGSESDERVCCGFTVYAGDDGGVINGEA